MSHEMLHLLRKPPNPLVDWSGWIGSNDGTETITNEFNAQYIGLTELNENAALLICQRQDGSYTGGIAAVVTRSGKSVTIGSNVQLGGGFFAWARAVLVRETSSEWVLVVMYGDSSSSLQGRAITVSKTDYSISAKTVYTSFQNPNSRFHLYYSGSKLADGKALFVAASNDTIGGVRYLPMAYVLTVDSSYVITFGTITVLASHGVSAIACFALSDTKAIAVFTKAGFTDRLQGVLLTISGSAVTANAPIDVSDMDMSEYNVYLDAIECNGRGVIAFAAAGKLYARILTEQAGAIIKGTLAEIFSLNSYRPEIAVINDRNLMFSTQSVSVQVCKSVAVGADNTLTPSIYHLTRSFLSDSSGRQKDLVRMGQNHVLLCVSPTGTSPRQFSTRILAK